MRQSMWNLTSNNFKLFNFPSFLCWKQLLDEKKLKEVDNLYLEFESPENANKL